MIFNKTHDKQTLKKWYETLIPQMKEGVDLKASKTFKAALKQGVPIEARGEVWEMIIGNDLRITSNLYDALLKRARTSEENIENDIEQPFLHDSSHKSTVDWQIEDPIFIAHVSHRNTVDTITLIFVQKKI